MTRPVKSLGETERDETLRPEDGWVGMDVRWLVTDSSFGARHHAMARVLFEPGGRHLAHAHPDAEEILYVLRGRLCATVGEHAALVGPEDVCYVPAGMPHALWNASTSEPCEALMMYGGAPSLEGAGYVRRPEPGGRSHGHRGGSPWVRTLATVPSDVRLTPDTGWVNMDVKWLVTDAAFGARHCVLGRTVFPPGARHEGHAHPRAEEALYVVRGRGETLDGETWYPMGVEDVVFTGTGVRHGFRNLSPTEPCETLWTYGGVSSLAGAGYVEMR
jgi:quercetin dioxygenase-like cupin family protein